MSVPKLHRCRHGRLSVYRPLVRPSKLAAISSLTLWCHLLTLCWLKFFSYWNFIIYIYIRELSWRHGASMSTYSVINKELMLKVVKGFELLICSLFTHLSCVNNIALVESLLLPCCSSRPIFHLLQEIEHLFAPVAPKQLCYSSKLEGSQTSFFIILRLLHSLYCAHLYILHRLGF